MVRKLMLVAALVLLPLTLSAKETGPGFQPDALFAKWSGAMVFDQGGTSIVVAVEFHFHKDGNVDLINRTGDDKDRQQFRFDKEKRTVTFIEKGKEEAVLTLRALHAGALIGDIASKDGNGPKIQVYLGAAAKK